MKTNTATLPPEADEPGRVLKPIPAAALQLDHAGAVFRSFVVRLPADYVLGDLSDPTIWRLIQGTKGGLRKFDRLTVIAFDESWLAEAVVTSATGLKATISKPVKIDMLSRADQEWSDGKYRILWSGPGFAIVRILDQQIMGSAHANMALAMKAVAQLYPQPVA